jgi:hypothetical protein
VHYITAQAEYAAFMYYTGAVDMAKGVGLRALGQEGLARNFYEACGSADTTCSDHELYRFLSAYEPWFRLGYEPEQRARHLLRQINRPVNRAALESDISQILDHETAAALGWTDGKIVRRPWQWINRPVPPRGTGYSPWDEAIDYLLIGSYYTWVLTADQDYYYHRPDERPTIPSIFDSR